MLAVQSCRSWAAAVAAAAVLVGSGAAFAQDGGGAAEAGHSRVADDWYAFPIPALSDDRTAGSPIDLSFLSPDPAGAHGHLRSRGDGEVVDGDGTVVKLFGTNICDQNAMPPADLARPIARRLAELGVNFVRLHYYDYAPAPDGMMRPDGETLDPDKLDQFHRLIAELAAAGVYVDVNLHVARHYPQQPASWGVWMGKGVDRVLPRLIESQKSFARQVLLAPNPHRDGRTLATDPAVAFVEINNENSLMQDHWRQLSTLPPDDLAPVRARWNAFLLDRYGDTASLRAAWNDGLPADGAELVPGGAAELTVEASGGGVSTVGPVEAPGGTPGVAWTVTRKGGAEWSHQLHRNGVAATDGQPLVLRLKYRASSPMKVRLMYGAEPWSSVSGVAGLPATDGDGWAEAAVSWTVESPLAGVPVRLSLDANNAAGDYAVAGLSLREGALPGVGDGESLEAGTVPVPGLSGNGRATAAWRDFCESLELDYTAEMCRFLRDDLGVTAMLIDTQANYGGGVGLVREVRYADAIDLHGYPAHPVDLRAGGGPAQWRVPQVSMLSDDALHHLVAPAFWTVRTRPTAVTEFDLNPPQDHNSESYPLLALVAAYQRWDALGEYAWMNFQADYDFRALPHPFATAGNPAQVAFMPASALLFRSGLVAPAGHPLTLTVGEGALLDADLGWGATRAVWERFGVAPASALRQSLALDVVPGDADASLAGAPLPTGGAVIESDTGQIKLDRSTPGREVLTVDAPALKMAFGHTGGRSFDLGGTTVEVTRAGALAGDYANVAFVALDGKPVAESGKLLLMAVARVHGSGWRFYDDADTESSFAPGGPMAEPVSVRLTPPASPGGWRLRPLDGDGRPVGEGATGATLDTAGLRSLWFLVEPAATQAGDLP